MQLWRGLTGRENASVEAEALARRVSPFHAQTPGPFAVYHDYEECWVGARILPGDRMSGSDERMRCERCKALDYQVDWSK